MGKIIAFHSFRGGSGKSNIIANLATLGIKKGKKIGIIDCDIQSPGMHVLFQIDLGKINYTLLDFLQGNCSIKETVFEVITEKLFVFPTSLAANEMTTILRQGIDLEILTQGIDEIMNEFHLDYLFIDTHSGLLEETLLALSIADQVVIFMKPDDQDDQGTLTSIEIAQKLDVLQMGILINKVAKGNDMQDVKNKIKKRVQVPIYGVLPFSKEMVKLKSSEIFVSQYPDHPITKLLKNVFKKLIPEVFS